MKQEHQPERPKLNLKQDFRRGNDLFVFDFNEKSRLLDTSLRVRRAFVEGFTCFLFRFTACKRLFEWRVALPPAAGFDEKDALDLGAQAFERFENTKAQLEHQKRLGIVEQINADP